MEGETAEAAGVVKERLHCRSSSAAQDQQQQQTRPARTESPPPSLTVEIIDSMALPCFAEAIPPKSQRRTLKQVRAANVERKGQHVRLARTSSMPGAMLTSLTASDYEIFQTGICQSDPGNRPGRRLRRTRSVAFAPEVLLTAHEVTARSSSETPGDVVAPEPQLEEEESPPVSPVQEENLEGGVRSMSSTRPPVYNARGETQVESDEEMDDEVGDFPHFTLPLLTLTLACFRLMFGSFSV